jgi:nucleoside-diphosphate-sugar epimerase
MPHSPRILVTGARGQLGTVLVNALAERYGAGQIIVTDIKEPTAPLLSGLTFETLDVLDSQRLQELLTTHRITQIYHLAAILSATGEAKPLLAWQVNMQGLLAVLESARLCATEKVFFPSTIAVFGPDAPRSRTPNNAVLHPTTVYGIAKVAGESWCQYYFQHYGLDVRSLRYPGIIGWQSLPGGGTTDYAMELFQEVESGQLHHCFLREDTCLPMIYMEDAIRATLELMEAPAAQIKVRTSYNIAGVSFTPAELVAAIIRHIPSFTVDYLPDFRQQIADNWPQSIDDTEAQQDWGWKPNADLDRIVEDMLVHLRK